MDQVSLLKWFIAFVLFVFIFTPIFPQQDSTLKQIPIKSSAISKENTKETLFVKTITDDKNNSLSDHFPWIAALIIGISSAFINYGIARRQRISNEKSLQLQMNNSKEIAITQIKGVINTKNRQEWVNDLRHCLSEFITSTLLLTFELKLKDKNWETIKNRTDKVLYSKSKI